MDIASALTALGLGAYVPLALAIIGLASVLAAVLPQPSPGTPYARVRAVLDYVAANVGNARNAPKTGA